MKPDARKLSVALAALMATTISIRPSGAENKTRALYISSMAPAPPLVPTLKSPGSAVNLQSSKHFEQGLAFKKSGDNNRALIEFLQAIKENPRCTRAFYEQALIFRSKGYPKLAESSLCQALAVDSNFREARILLAAVRLEAGNTGGAAQELTRSLGLADNLKLISPAPPVVKSQIPSTTNTAVTKNSLVFQSEAAKLETGKMEMGKLEAAKPVAGKLEGGKIEAGNKIADDDWAKRLKYLSVNGTGSLKAGEAFMFSEETGEAVIFLADGRRVRRIISAPQDTHELVKARRPDMLIPADLLYKLSTLGKLVGGDPSAIIDLNEGDSKSRATIGQALSAEESEPVKKSNLKKGPDKESGTLGELMDSDEPAADNSYTRKAIFDNGEFDKDASPAMANDAKKGPTLNSTEPGSFKDFNKEPASETIVEKTQKLFTWLKKTLHI